MLLEFERFRSLCAGPAQARFTFEEHAQNGPSPAPPRLRVPPPSVPRLRGLCAFEELAGTTELGAAESVRVSGVVVGRAGPVRASNGRPSLKQVE